MGTGAQSSALPSSAAEPSLSDGFQPWFNDFMRRFLCLIFQFLVNFFL